MGVVGTVALQPDNGEMQQARSCSTVRGARRVGGDAEEAAETAYRKAMNQPRNQCRKDRR